MSTDFIYEDLENRGIDDDQYVIDGYEKIGAGAFRAVLSIPGKPEMVLKIVSPAIRDVSNKRLSMDMNRQEAEGGYQTASEMVPKTYDSARDHFWIILGSF